MSGKRELISYKGRSLGILALTVAQLLIGAIHLLVGLTLLAIEISTSQGSIPYDVYTIAFGSLILYLPFSFGKAKKQDGLAPSPSCCSS